MSLRRKLHSLIQTHGRLSYGEICNYIAQEGYKVSYGERELRHLAEEKKIGTERSKSKRNTEYISAYLAKEPEQKKLQYKIIIKDGVPVAVQL